MSSGKMPKPPLKPLSFTVFNKGTERWVDVRDDEKSHYQYLLESRKPQQNPTVNLSRLNEAYKEREKEFKESSYFQKLKELFESRAMKDLGIDKIVCVCLGSASYNDNMEKWCFTQLAVVEYLQESLKIKKNMTLFQDPAFNKLDRQWLEGKGYTIVNDPGAYTSMTLNTLLYNAGGDFCVTAYALDRAWPKVYMGTDLFEYEPNLASYYKPDKTWKDLRDFHDIGTIPRYLNLRQNRLNLPQAQWTKERKAKGQGGEIFIADVVYYMTPSVQVAPSIEADSPENLLMDPKYGGWYKGGGPSK